MPKRIRLQRTKGWRLPSGAVVVARPSRWGNPFLLNGDDRDEVLRAYREHVEEKLKGDPSWLEPLRGRDLALLVPPRRGLPCRRADRAGEPLT